MQDEYIVLDATGGKGREIFLNSSKDIGFPIDFTIAKAYQENDSKFIIEFVASTEDLDSQGHIITGQAMKEAAQGLLGKTLLYNHDLNRGIGKVIDVKVEKYKSKWSIVAKAFISSAESEIIQKVQDGTLDSFSIKALIPESGRSKVWKEAEQKFITVITKMTLVEVSLVTIPANANALLVSSGYATKMQQMQQYIQKALSTYYSKGYDNNSIDLNGGDMNNLNFSSEVIEEIQKHLNGSEPEKVEESTETAEKSEDIETVEKAEKSKLRDAIAGIMKETDMMRMKKKLEDLLRGMEEGKYPYPEAKACRPGHKGKKEELPMAKSDSPDFAELLKGMDPELLKVFVSQLEEQEEVEKAGRKFSAKNEQMLNDIRAMLAKAVAGLEEISGKTDQKAEVKKLQDDFGNVEKYLKEITEVKDRQAVEVTEKLAIANLDLSKQSQELSGQVKGMIQKMNAILEGAPAVRNEDGTISVGKDAIKAIADTEDPRSPNGMDIITKSEEYQKMDAGEKFNKLSEYVADTF